MCPRGRSGPALAAFAPFRAGVVLLAGCALAIPASARAQDDPPPEAAVESADDRIEAYLSELGLDRVLAAHLDDRLGRASGKQRLDVAERLGRLYVRLLEEADASESRQEVEALARDLLERVPEAESFDLRLSLAKATYLVAEGIAERHRLRLGGNDDRAEAERILRASGSVFQQIGLEANRRVATFEKQEESGRDVDEAYLRTVLAEARRTRSLAMYYAGWSSYYLGVITTPQPHAAEALKWFGWVVGGGDGKPARVADLTPELLGYEHVARASIGCALAESLRGNDAAALAWLDAVDLAESVPEAVRDQLFARKLWIVASARRWADLEWMLDERRKSGGSGTLETGDARLAAVATLTALNRADLDDRVRGLVEELAQGALGDLVARGEVGHVLDLVTVFGSAPMGGEGFIVNYVRALQSYRAARDAHAAAGQDTEEPTTTDTIANQYRDASGLLEAAIAAGDTDAYAKERSSAGLMLGLALFYAGDFERASAALQAAHAQAASTDQAEQALWLAIVALDRAVEADRPSLAPDRDRLGALYIRSFPAGERAALLLLRRSSSGLLSDEQAVGVLLAVKPESPVYGAARRHAAAVLYRLYRAARGPDRDFAASRFLSVAEEVLAAEREALAKGTSGGEVVVGLVRQILDASLGSAVPDLTRAEAALTVLDATAAQHAVSLESIADELAFRRFQMALARSPEGTEVDRALDELHALGGRYSDAADRLLYQRAADRWSADRADLASARLVVRHGARVMTTFAPGPEAIADAGVATLHNTVAAAAFTVWQAEADESMRDVALRVDRALLEAGRRTESVLVRVAQTAESAGDAAAALDAWRALLAGRPADEPGWFEARYQSARLLAAADPARALDVLTQHAALHPHYGPDPWGAKLRALHDELRAAPQPPASDPPAEGSGPS